MTEIVLDYGSLGMGKSRQIMAGSSLKAFFPFRRAVIFLVLWLIVTGCLMSAESPAIPAGLTTTNDASTLMRETRQYVAKVTEERNLLRDENETLRSRQGLLAIYGAVMTLLAAWLMVRELKGGKKGETAKSGESDIFSSSTSTERDPSPTVVMRKNATITIRNSATQQAEVTSRVQTRQAFARTDTAIQPRPITRSIARTPTPPVAAPTIGSESVRKKATTPPAAEPVPTPAPTPGTQTRTHTTTQRPTVRIEQHSDRLDPIEVAVRPGTGSIRRNPGVSSVEMLIAILMVTALAIGSVQIVVNSHSPDQPGLRDHNGVFLKR